MRLAFVVAAILHVSACVLQAQAQTVARDCAPSRTVEIKIAACSRVLQTTRLAQLRERAFNTRGLAYLGQGNFARAVDDFSEVIRLNPAIAGYYDNRQNALRGMGRVTEALADANTAVRLAPTYAFVYRARGNIFDELRNFKAAEDDYAKAIEIAPTDAGLYYDRGRISGHAGDTEAAEASYSKALTLDPAFAGALRERGLLYQMTGHPDMARADFSAALALTPNDAVVLAAVVALPAVAAVTKPVEMTPAAPSDHRSADKRIALVIGNSAYASAPFLPNPRDDATRVAGALRASGFAAEVRLDLTRDQLLTALAEFAATSEAADWAMIYYAGHGIELAGINYLVPIDAKLVTDRSVSFEAVTLDQAINAVSGAHKLRLVVLDACRENPFVNRIRLSTASRSVARGLARPPEEDPGTLVVYAARDGAVAQDGNEGAGSPFAAAFVEEMRRPGLDIRRMFDLVSDDVMEKTGHRQQPLTYGRLPGREDFFFTAGP